MKRDPVSEMESDTHKWLMKIALHIALVSEDWCPLCLAELDEGWECTECGADASEYVVAIRHEMEE